MGSLDFFIFTYKILKFIWKFLKFIWTHLKWFRNFWLKLKNVMSIERAFVTALCLKVMTKKCIFYLFHNCVKSLERLLMDIIDRHLARLKKDTNQQTPKINSCQRWTCDPQWDCLFQLEYWLLHCIPVWQLFCSNNRWSNNRNINVIAFLKRPQKYRRICDKKRSFPLIS